jgi:hypothetical protein
MIKDAIVNLTPDRVGHSFERCSWRPKFQIVHHSISKTLLVSDAARNRLDIAFPSRNAFGSRPFAPRPPFGLKEDRALKMAATLRSLNCSGQRSGIIEANVLYHSLLGLASAESFGQLLTQVDCRSEMRP